MIKSVSQKRMAVFANLVLLFFAICAILPFILLVIASVTENGVAITDGYSFFPAKFSMAAYEYLMKEWGTLGRGYFMTIIVTVSGTALGLTITSMLAYALFVKGLPGGRILMMMVIISMLFLSLIHI